MEDREPRNGGRPAGPDWRDALALMIAAFQLLLPVLALFFALAAAVYLLVRWWAR